MGKSGFVKISCKARSVQNSILPHLIQHLALSPPWHNGMRWPGQRIVFIGHSAAITAEEKAKLFSSVYLRTTRLESLRGPSQNRLTSQEDRRKVKQKGKNASAAADPKSTLRAMNLEGGPPPFRYLPGLAVWQELWQKRSTASRTQRKEMRSLRTRGSANLKYCARSIELPRYWTWQSQRKYLKNAIEVIYIFLNIQF